MGSEAELAQVADEVRGCTRCPLAARRTHAVPGEGNLLSDVLLVGEGPGAREDATGRPFVGPAGQLLSELLGSIGWERGDVFITNVVKCRPPGNRDPEPAEIGTCASYLERQEAALEPAVVVSLGRHSLQRYLPGSRIGAVHGQLRRSFTGQHVFPMYHPAAALHQASLRETLFRDIRGLPAALLAAREALGSESERMAEADDAATRVIEPERGAPDVDGTQQMTLFQEH
ncbi:MAG TPA: uracil-DNA glycosylase [Candidatus Angelobacter sp.]|nr:uracil-DNA glycosylase [Candidatus Angelobacter sp.]